MSAVSVEQLGIVAGEIVLPITVGPFSGFGGRVAGPARASGPGLETGGRGCRFDQSCLVADTEKFADLSQFTGLVCQHVLVVDRKPPSVKDALSLPVVPMGALSAVSASRSGPITGGEVGAVPFSPV